MEFTLRGKFYKAEREDVIRVVKGIESEPVRIHFVEINGSKYPPKQVFGLLTGLSRIHFTSMDACGILERLGFEVKALTRREGVLSPLGLTKRPSSKDPFDKYIGGVSSGHLAKDLEGELYGERP